MQVSRWALENMWCIISCLGPLSHEDAGLCWEGEQRLASLVGHKVLDGAPSLWIWNLRRLCHGLIGKTNSVSYRRLLAASSASFLQGGIGGQQESSHGHDQFSNLCYYSFHTSSSLVIHDCTHPLPPTNGPFNPSTTKKKRLPTTLQSPPTCTLFTAWQL